MPEPIRPSTPSSPDHPSGRGEDLRAGGVSPRARQGGVRARVEGVLTSAQASTRTFEKGFALAREGNVHSTLYPHIWHVVGDRASDGTVTLYSVHLLDPSCGCNGWGRMRADLRAQGLVCKHIVAAGVVFLEVGNQYGPLQ